MPEEQQKHREAFDLYRTLGSRRSYKQVADQMGVSASTIKLWSRSFGWRQRLSKHEAQRTRETTERITQASQTEDSRNLKIVQAALINTARAIAENRIKPQMGDLDKLIRLEEYLREKQPASTVNLPRDPVELRKLARQLLVRALQVIDADCLETEYAGYRGTLPPEADAAYLDRLREVREEMTRKGDPGEHEADTAQA